MRLRQQNHSNTYFHSTNLRRRSIATSPPPPLSPSTMVPSPTDDPAIHVVNKLIPYIIAIYLSLEHCYKYHASYFLPLYITKLCLSLKIEANQIKDRNHEALDGKTHSTNGRCLNNDRFDTHKDRIEQPGNAPC